MQNAAGSAENLKPGLVMEAFLHFLQLPAEEFRFSHHRLEMYANVGTEGQRRLVTLESLGKEITDVSAH